jgi:hypothetical protein
MKEDVKQKEAYMPHEWVNYKSLRAELSFIEILHHYGVELKERGEQWQGFCPLPTHEGNASITVILGQCWKGDLAMFWLWGGWQPH